MNGQVKEDFERGRKHLNYIKRVLGQYLIAEAPFEEDVQRNTDLIVLTLNALRIACRVRTHDYFKRYPNEFTIRSSRPSGAQTELAKVMTGWGDYIFYGFENEDNSSLCSWLLGDLAVFRTYIREYVNSQPDELPGKELPNRDGSSKFRAFRVFNMPDTFIIARKVPPVAAVNIDLYKNKRNMRSQSVTSKIIQNSLFQLLTSLVFRV